jgi:HPt (histidine-containing phosphotransfer) domain-containing protein
MHPSRDNSANLVWNLAELLSRVDNDQELLADLLAIFKVEFPRNLQALEAAVAGADLKKTAALSHTLKGMLSNLACTRSAAAVSRLESLASVGDGTSLLDALQQFKQEAARLVPEVEAYMAGVHG